jgi:hypothetical protein
MIHYAAVFVTIMVYFILNTPFVTVIATVFSPSFHVAALPLVCAEPLTVMATVAPASAAVAVMVFVAFVVAAV